MSQNFKKESSNKLSLNNSHKCNIIVTDDELFTRQATIRTLKSVSKLLNINLRILEAQDGVETVFLVYKCLNEGVKISMIFSDENMNFMNGIKSCNIIKEILDKSNLGIIPYYLLTSFDNKMLDGYGNLTKVLEKPLEKSIAIEILKGV
jgi:response regulator RpfG family c-di-GMP phosphodiesterase